MRRLGIADYENRGPPEHLPWGRRGRLPKAIEKWKAGSGVWRRKRQDEGIGYKGDGSKKARKHLPKSEARLDPEKRTRRTLEPTSEQQETLHEPQSSDVVPASKKKRKRKDTPS